MRLQLGHDRRAGEAEGGVAAGTGRLDQLDGRVVPDMPGRSFGAVSPGEVLGPQAEDYLIQSLEMSGGEWSILFDSILAKVLWGMILLSLGASQVLAWRERSLAARRTMVR